MQTLDNKFKYGIVPLSGIFTIGLTEAVLHRYKHNYKPNNKSLITHACLNGLAYLVFYSFLGTIFPPYNVYMVFVSLFGFRGMRSGILRHLKFDSNRYY